MKPEEVKKLTEKFYTGETSVDEEQRLKEYFGQGRVPDEFKAAKEYFDFLHTEKELSLDEAFDTKFFEAAGANTSRQTISKAWIYRVSGLAAMALVLIWLGVKVFKPVQEEGTVTDPVVAFNETRMAFNLVAFGINKSLKPAGKAVKTIDESLQKVYDLGKWNSNLEKTGKMMHTSRNAIKNNS